MNRRDLLAVITTIAALPAARALAAAGDLRGAAREAYVYALAPIEMAAARARMLGAKPGQGQPAGINRFGHTRTLATAANRAITSPNNDTLYSSAWLDLTQGPVTLTIPPTGDRYISVAIMNMYTDNDVILGTRTTGNGGGRYTIVGPGQAGSGPNTVRIATPHAWLLTRILTDGPADLPATHKVQDALKLEGPAGAAPQAYATRTSPWKDYFASAQKLLLSDPPPATDGVALGKFGLLGIGPRGGFDPSRFDAAQIEAIKAGIADAIPAIVQGSAANVVNGWTYPRSNIGDFGQDYLFRAGVALAGLAALTPAEAAYLRPLGDSGRGNILNGAYRLSFAPGQLPPVNGFWSLTMYEATPDGQFFLTANPIDRYSIGDRTPGLKKGADGALDIWIGRTDPGGDKTANWLPAPAKGPFTVSLRTYLPKFELLDGRWRAPALMRLEP